MENTKEALKELGIEVELEKIEDFRDIIKKDNYRIKGFFNLDNEWYQVDVVNKTIDYKKTDRANDNSELVIISKIGLQIIKPIFTAWGQVVGNVINDKNQDLNSGFYHLLHKLQC